MADTTPEAVERNICNPIISHVHDGRGLSEKRCGEIIDTARALVAENERLRADLANAVRVKPLVSPIGSLLPDAIVQAEKAMRKFPQPNYVISKWAEESGEVTKALIHAAEGRETWENVRSELVDTLAMLHRLMVEGDEVHGLPALRALIDQPTQEPD